MTATIGDYLNGTLIINGQNYLIGGTTGSYFTATPVREKAKIMIGQGGAGLYAEDQTAAEHDIEIKCFKGSKLHLDIETLYISSIQFSIQVIDKVSTNGNIKTINSNFSSCKVTKQTVITLSSTAEDVSTIATFSLKGIKPQTIF